MEARLHFSLSSDWDSHNDGTTTTSTTSATRPEMRSTTIARRARTTNFVGSNQLRRVGSDEWSITMEPTTLRPRCRRPSSTYEPEQHEERNNHNNWDISTLRRVPMYYPLEKTSIHIKNTPKEVIADRISQYLRVNSIGATYRGDRVDCLTHGQLKFVVQLWQGDNNNHDNDTIVEFQRRHGCAILMRRVRCGIIQAIHEPPTQPEAFVEHTPSCQLKASMDRALKNDTCEDAMNIAEHLMESKNLDQKQLGMESLASLTSSCNIQNEGDCSLAQRLVWGDGSTCIQHCFVKCFQHTDENFAEGYGRGVGTMHHLALIVLANALETIVKYRDDNQNIDIRSHFWRTIIEALVHDIEVTEDRPQEAALATRCFGLLASLSPKLLRTRIVEDRLLPSLIQANEFGMGHHLMLETESRNLMSRLADVQ